MALDTRFPAGMTAFMYKGMRYATQHIPISMKTTSCP